MEADNIQRQSTTWHAYLHKAFHFLFHLLISPQSLKEDDRRREFILNIILIASIGLLLICDGFILTHSIHLKEDYTGMSFWAFSCIVGAFIFLYILSRKGYIKTASHLVVFFYYVSISYAAYAWGADLQQALLGYVLIIFISTILLGSMYGFISTGIISITLSIIWYLQMTYRVIPEWDWKYQPEYGDGIQFVILFFLIMILSWLANREIEKTLNRARSSERALKIEKDWLEIKVEERTTALKRTQSEKIAQLYRFAEFGKLSSGIFHDLINPLTSVALNVTRLDEGRNSQTAETKHLVQNAITASKRMEEFLAAVRKQIQAQDLETLFSVNHEIEQAIQLLNYSAREKGISIIFSAKEDIQTYGNPLKFHQIALNLISNAIDSYSTHNTDRTIKIEAKLHKNSISVSVSDNGSGILPEILPKIFDPFFTTKPTHKGSGLGLSTTKEIIEKDFRGQVTVFSTPEKGSTFTITLPQKNHEND
jgi:signal transduction histidine kinase